jgi:hypothetical protein
VNRGFKRSLQLTCNGHHLTKPADPVPLAELIANSAARQ